jgi:hypothetical protein
MVLIAILLIFSYAESEPYWNQYVQIREGMTKAQVAETVGSDPTEKQVFWGEKGYEECFWSIGDIKMRVCFSYPDGIVLMKSFESPRRMDPQPKGLDRIRDWLRRHI